MKRWIGGLLAAIALLEAGCVRRARGADESGTAGAPINSAPLRLVRRDLATYPAGRRAEIRWLEQVPDTGGGLAILDSVGASMAHRSPEAYRDLVGRIDEELGRSTSKGTPADRLADSLRVARLILLIRKGQR